MPKEELQKKTTSHSGYEHQSQGKNANQVIPLERARKDLNYINETFNITDTVNHLHKIMKEVTSQEITSKTVNAACNCVSQLNQTINTTIHAARYLSQSKNEEE